MSKILVGTYLFYIQEFFIFSERQSSSENSAFFQECADIKKMREKGWPAFQLFLPWSHPLTTKYLKIDWAKPPLSNHEYNVWKSPLRDKMLWVSCFLPYRWRNSRIVKHLKYMSKRNIELVTVISLGLWRPWTHMPSSNPHGRISSIEIKPHS